MHHPLVAAVPLLFLPVVILIVNPEAHALGPTVGATLRLAGSRGLLLPVGLLIIIISSISALAWSTLYPDPPGGLCRPCPGRRWIWIWLGESLPSRADWGILIFEPP